MLHDLEILKYLPLCSPLSTPNQMGCTFLHAVQAGFEGGQRILLSGGGLWEEF